MLNDAAEILARLWPFGLVLLAGVSMVVDPARYLAMFENVDRAMRAFENRLRGLGAFDRRIRPLNGSENRRYNGRSLAGARAFVRSAGFVLTACAFLRVSGVV
jgi:hypothetical protein